MKGHRFFVVAGIAICSPWALVAWDAIHNQIEENENIRGKSEKLVREEAERESEPTGTRYRKSRGVGGNRARDERGTDESFSYLENPAVASRAGTGLHEKSPSFARYSDFLDPTEESMANNAAPFARRNEESNSRYPTGIDSRSGEDDRQTGRDREPLNDLLLGRSERYLSAASGTVLRGAIEARFQSESTDMQWTQSTRQFVADAMKAAELGEDRVKSVECRDTLCRMELEFDGLAEANALRSLADPDRDSRYFFEKSRLTVFAARPGERVFDDPSIEKRASGASGNLSSLPEEKEGEIPEENNDQEGIKEGLAGLAKLNMPLTDTENVGEAADLPTSTPTIPLQKANGVEPSFEETQLP